MEFKIVEGSQLRGLMIGLIIGLLAAIIIFYFYLEKFKKKLFIHKPKQNKNGLPEQNLLLEENFTVKEISTSSAFKGEEMAMEEAIVKIFDGCKPSRINFITKVLEKKNIRTTEDLKTLDSKALESLSGLTDVEVNKVKDYFKKVTEESFVIALKDAHVSRKNFFADILRENLDLTDLKNLDKYVMDSLKLLTRAEIAKIKKIAENKLRTKFMKYIPEAFSGYKKQGTDSYTLRHNKIRDLFLHSPLEMCSWFEFELMEALKRFRKDEIEQIKTFIKKATAPVERLFKGLDSSRISVIESVMMQHDISDIYDLNFDLKLLETCEELSASELQTIKRSYKKWHEMTFEAALVEIFGATDDVKIHSLTQAFKKFKDVYMFEEFHLFHCATDYNDFGIFTYNQIKIMKKCVEKTLQESVAEALKDSGLLRINFVLKALLRQDLSSTCKLIYYGDKEKCDGAYSYPLKDFPKGLIKYPNPLNVLQQLSETEISKIMAFYHKSLKEVVNEIMEGCDGSRIDFVTKILNKYGIRKHFHLLKYPYKLENIEELTDDEVVRIKTFIHKNDSQHMRIEHLLKKLRITHASRTTFIMKLMKGEHINTSIEFQKLNWPFFDILMGLRDSEVKKLKEFIQTKKKMSIYQTIENIFKEWDYSRIDFIRRTLENEGIYTTEYLLILFSNALEDLRGLTDDEVNKIKNFWREKNDR